MVYFCERARLDGTSDGHELDGRCQRRACDSDCPLCPAEHGHFLQKLVRPGCFDARRGDWTRPLGPLSLARAQSALARFDAVLILERLGDPSYRTAVYTAIGGGAGGDGPRSPAATDDVFSRKNAGAHARSAARSSTPPPALRDELEALNALDIELYRWAWERSWPSGAAGAAPRRDPPPPRASVRVTAASTATRTGGVLDGGGGNNVSRPTQQAYKKEPYG